MNKKGRLIILIGPSGSGKGTVLKEVLQSEENTFLSVSATTRRPREGEIDGLNYFFLDKEKFEALRDGNGLLEYAAYCENFYGTPKAPVFERLSRGENVILEIEVQGAKQIKERFPDAVSIFIIPPSLFELRRRLTNRKTEDEETVNKRLETAMLEINYAYECDYIVINDVLSEAVDHIRAIISAESCSVSCMSGFIDEILSTVEGIRS